MICMCIKLYSFYFCLVCTYFCILFVFLPTGFGGDDHQKEYLQGGAGQHCIPALHVSSISLTSVRNVVFGILASSPSIFPIRPFSVSDPPLTRLKLRGGIVGILTILKISLIFQRIHFLYTSTSNVLHLIGIQCTWLQFKFVYIL